VGGGEWYLAVPPGWRPLPAASAGPLLDRRVVLGEPPGAFRYDVRAVGEPYLAEDGEDYVDVVSEHDWYRSRIRREPVPTSPYRLDRVWLEQGEEVTTAPADAAPGVFERLVSVDTPPDRPPRRAGDVVDIAGRRVVVIQHDLLGARLVPLGHHPGAAPGRALPALPGLGGVSQPAGLRPRGA
jgi:hypothetical protein